jgi:hypothetical protein
MKRFQTKPAGYALLVERHRLAVPELRRRSELRSDSSPRRLERQQGPLEIESFPASFERGDDDFDHLVFALKYDGIDLAVLTRIFLATDALQLARRIADTPTSKYSRRLFFLYERLTGARLDLPDTLPVSLVDVLDPAKHYTSLAAVSSPRHRVLDNLLGDASFCPIVRRTVELDRCVALGLERRAAQIVASADPTLLARAISFLYTKETKSSFAIEHEEPGDREVRFVANLGRIASLALGDEAGLTELQNTIVDPRYREVGFRKPGDPEVWVGQSLFGGREKVHHIGARSVVTSDLMKGLLRMREVEGPGAPVIEAAVKSFAFVFIHPFGDGNGRIHRLLLHHVLAHRGFLPRNLVVPISAVLVNDPRGYDEALEDFSARVLPLIEYRFDDVAGDTKLTILNQPDDFYRYPDLTRQCEATFLWLGRAIEEELVQELEFLRNYDEIRARVREIVEMPDRKEQLFIKLLLQNRGKLAKSKRRHFAELEDGVIAKLEAAIAELMS